MHNEHQPSSSKHIHEGILRIQSSKRNTTSNNKGAHSSGLDLAVNYDICRQSRSLPKQYINPKKALGTTEYVMQPFSLLDQTMPLPMTKRPASAARKGNQSRKLSTTAKRPPSVADSRPKPFDLSSHINVSGTNKLNQYLKFEGPLKKIEQMMGKSTEENLPPPPTEPVNHHVAKVRQNKLQNTMAPSPLLNSFYVSKPKPAPVKNPLDSLNNTHYFNPYRQSFRKGEDHHLFADTPLMFQPESKKGRYSPAGHRTTKISYIGVMNTTESQLHYDKSELSFKIDTLATLDSDRGDPNDPPILSKTSLDPRDEVRLSNTMDRKRKRKSQEFSYYRPTRSRQKPRSTSILEEDNYARSLTETSPCEALNRSTKGKSFLLGDSMQTQKLWLIEEHDTSKTIKTLGDIGNKSYLSTGPQLMIRALRSRKPSVEPTNNQNNSSYIKSLNDADASKKKKSNNLLDGLMGKRMEMRFERRDTSESKRLETSEKRARSSVKSRPMKKETESGGKQISMIAGSAKEILVKKEKRAKLLEKQLIIQQGEDEIQGWD